MGRGGADVNLPATVRRAGSDRDQSRGEGVELKI